jgi:hypothetical protein
MAKYLPGLRQGGNKDFVSESEGGYSALSVDVKNIDPLLDAISDGLQLARGSKLNFTMNPKTNHIALRAESEYLERNKLLVTNMNVNLTNQGDSLAMYLSAADMYASGIHLPQLTVMGGAKNNRVRLTTGFDNQADSVSGMLSLMAQLTRVEPNNMPRVDVTLYPATIYSQRKVWRINSDMISLDTTRIVVNNFRVSDGNQLLALNGVASRNNSDSLTLNLRQFEIEPFMGFAKRLGYAKPDGNFEDDNSYYNREMLEDKELVLAGLSQLYDGINTLVEQAAGTYVPDKNIRAIMWIA